MRGGEGERRRKGEGGERAKGKVEREKRIGGRE